MQTSQIPEPLTLTPMRVPRRKLTDHVYQQICELILNGEIKPGQLITIQALSDSFGVSAIPIREALHKLTGANALAVVSGRSIGIPPLNEQHLLDLMRVRQALEGAAARWAVPHVTDETVVALEELHASMLAASSRGDAKAFLRANRVFHFTLYRLSGSLLACDIIEKLWLQATPYFHLHYAADRYGRANEQHGLIMQGVKARDAQMVGKGIHQDIEKGCELALRLLKQ